MNDSPRLTTARLQWLFLLALLVLVVAIAFVPGWISGLIGIVVFLGLGYGGVAWYYRRYQQFHKPNDPQ
jgi:CHASE2 domain-containing sensor protein